MAYGCKKEDQNWGAFKRKNLITEAQLKVALNEQQTSGKKLGEVLEDLGYVTEKQLLQVISEQLGTKIIKAYLMWRLIPI